MRARYSRVDEVVGLKPPPVSNVLIGLELRSESLRLANVPGSER